MLEPLLSIVFWSDRGGHTATRGPDSIGVTRRGDRQSGVFSVRRCVYIIIIFVST